jgi:cobalt-zinc-cadmium resistance protein CzcA
MLTAFITVGGIISFQRMPVDAYPDLSPPQVEIITQWPDHAAEEVERLVTLPLELQMNGVPHMEVMRSISLYGLSPSKKARTAILRGKSFLSGSLKPRCPQE